ncbi:hypothetical protein VTJ83DRAFT_5001 [Remersonia thermophila]|uniref:RING-type domain-containing protein n=1 Tax=Remersonia thermophila TaxID=72144 RepID=A0ABR4DCH2_9PEZI
MEYEQRLSCNVLECSTQLVDRAFATICSHAICLRCAGSSGLTGQGPYACPVCRQPLHATEFVQQLLHPTEEWKTVALAGLSPTAVMECAGRALAFWSYQMTNQISYQTRRNSKLKDYCAELQGEVKSIWDQANQKLTSLTAKIRDMECEEHALRRQCEELRLTLESRTRELSQAQELYRKLKQKVLSGQAPEVKAFPSYNHRGQFRPPVPESVSPAPFRPVLAPGIQQPSLMKLLLGIQKYRTPIETNGSAAILAT